MTPQRYRFGPRIAAGATGEVYRGEYLSEGFSRPVAIKLLKVEFDHRDEVAARFRDEARMMARLQHPAIVRVEALCMLEGRLALVMELVDGVDLAAIRNHFGALPPRAVGELLQAVAGALQLAREAPGPDGPPMEIVHRDIKPQNIALDQHGGVKVLDFGAARARFAGREVETRGFVPGTLPYMAPERLDGALEGSHAGDMWAVGATGIELLLGQRWAVLLRRTMPPRSYLVPALSGVPGAAPLAELLLELVEEDPAQRPDAAAVLERLEEIGPVLPGASLRSIARAAVAAARAQQQEEEDFRFGTILSAAEANPGTPAAAGTRPPRLRVALVATVAAMAGLAAVLAVGLLSAGAWLRWGPSEDGAAPVAVQVQPDAAVEEDVVRPDLPSPAVAFPVEEVSSPAAPTPVAFPASSSRASPTAVAAVAPPAAEAPKSASAASSSIPSAAPLVQVGLKGDAIEAWLEPGTIRLPAKVSPGTYTPWAVFGGSSTPRKGTAFEVRDSQPVTVKCYGSDCRGI